MHDYIMQPSLGSRSQQTTFDAFNDLSDLFPRKASAVVQPIPVHASALSTPEKENQPPKPFSASPILSGYGSMSHNVARMLGENEEAPQKNHLSESNVNRSSRFTPYSTSHFLSYRPKLKTQDSHNTYRHDDEPILDMGNVSDEHLRTGDAPNITDSSISTQGTSSPQSSASSASPSGSSTRSSPGSGLEPATSPENADEQTTKKKARTNYTNEQVQTLLKIFHENPYPDSEMMETIARDLGVPENKIKIWFQNKRARWRRRVNDNMNTYPQPFFPVSPMLSPVNPYGFMPTAGHMMTSSPPQPLGGYFNYPWMQTGSMSSNNNQHYPTNPMQSRPQPGNNSTLSHMTSQQYPPVTMTTPSVSTLSSVSPYSVRTSPQNMVTSQQGRQFQYPQFRYQSNYGANNSYMGQ